MTPVPARALALAFALSCSWGCAAHVVLPPPPDPSTSEELRRAYFEQNRAAPVTREMRAPRARMFESTPVFLQRSIALKSGAQVTHVEDLRPLVADDSQAAQAIELAVNKGGDARTITTAAGITSGVGVAAGLTALILGITGVDTEFLPDLDLGGTEDVPNVIPGYVLYGGGTALVTLAVGTGLAIWGSTADDAAATARAQAFQLFDDGLRAKLGLTSSASAAPGAPTESAPTESAPVPSDEPFETPTLDVTPPE